MSTSSGETLLSRRMRHLFAACLALCIGLLALPAAADTVEYYATVDRERMALDETLTLQVMLAFDQDADMGEVILPEAPDFDVRRQGRSDQMSFSFGSGGSNFRKVRSYTLVLAPRREGKLVILPGKVEVGGKRYETGRLTVEVLPARGGQQGAPPSPSQPGIPPDPLNELLGEGPQPAESDLFLRATLDREAAFVGEQVTLSVWLLSRVDVSHVEGLKMPRLDGFWAEELETPRRLAAQTRVVDGVTYRAYLIQRRALFPLRAGEIAIEPVELDIVTGRSIFRGGRRQHRKSTGATLEVKELPTGAPAAFRRSNVGDWKLRVEASPHEVPLGNPVTVRLVAEGTGNLRNLEMPQLPTVEGFKIFEPTRRDDVQIRGDRYGGAKTVEYVLVPERAGRFEIPAFDFAVFDPASGGYRSTRTAPVALTVLQGGAVAAAQGAPPVQPPERRDDGGLQPLRQAPVIVAAEVPLYERPWFLAALLAPALAVIGVVATPLLRTRIGLPQRRRRRKAGGLPGRLRELARSGDPSFFAACERLLFERAADRLGRPAQGMQRSELAEALGADGVGTDAVAAFIRALELSELARYAPGALQAGAIEEALAATEAAIAGLEDAA